MQVPPELIKSITFLALNDTPNAKLITETWELKNKMQQYMKTIGLRNGSRTRRAAPTVSGMLIEPVVYQEL